MSLSDRPAGNPARVALVVLLAAVFLAVIGASVGYIVAQAHRTTTGASRGGGGDNGGDNGGTGNGGNNNNGGTTPSTGGGGSTTTVRRACLDVTEKAAKDRGSPGGLVQLLYIDTALSEVWICRDSGGKLWYQGHRKSQAERNGGTREPFVEGENSLFLGTVERRGQTSYVATNVTDTGTTRYLVSEQELVIDNGAENQQHQQVEHAEIG
jgi:hypothetical protein